MPTHKLGSYFTTNTYNTVAKHYMRAAAYALWPKAKNSIQKLNYFSGHQKYNTYDFSSRKLRLKLEFLNTIYYSFFSLNFTLNLMPVFQLWNSINKLHFKFGNLLQFLATIWHFCDLKVDTWTWFLFKKWPINVADICTLNKIKTE